MEDLISQRKGQLMKVEKLLIDIHGVAKDIGIEL